MNQPRDGEAWPALRRCSSCVVRPTDSTFSTGTIGFRVDDST
jgi:hypothetical protein